ncbi:Multidrug resistance protein [Acetobacter pasteurianus]|uniref:Bcr/CflA family efflux transporter n=1 Tax=Acetobacter pasteurianus TaxID=438 RepID=A0A1A0D7Q3_ACEPA|nr:multidrug effflux MFS transporter [Acetobacter pasteurianus]OAZ71075.1 Multidrug resistance protein [Acetobacter pasteurianus]
MTTSSAPPALFKNGLPLRLILLLGLVTAIGPLATDMYLPAFPDVERDLGGGAGSAQFTLGAWFLGLAFGQFSQGPLSDRFGRKVPLVIGLAVFAVASAMCAVVRDYHLFCIMRFIGAFGGSASAVIPRAIVRDVATGKKGAHIMAQLTLVFGVMPVLAPSMGSLVLEFGNWRWIFWSGTLYAVLGMIGIICMLPDTLSPAYRMRLAPFEIFTRYRTILREPVFLSNALITTFSTFVMFAYLGSAPVLFEQVLHFSPTAFGMFFGVNAAAFILGTQINGRLVHKFAMPALLQAAILWALIMGGIFVVVACSGLAGLAHPWLTCGLITCITGALGFIGPNGTVMAFSRHAHQAGSASALLGTMQFSLGSLSNVLVGVLPGGGAIPTAIGMMTGVIGMVCANILRRRHTDQAEHEHEG